MLVEGSPHNMIAALRFTMVYCHSEENKSNIFCKTWQHKVPINLVCKINKFHSY